MAGPQRYPGGAAVMSDLKVRPPKELIFCGAELPEDLAEHAEQDGGVGGREVEAMDETADFIFGGGSRTFAARGGRALSCGSGGTLPARKSGVGLDVAAGAQGVEEHGDDALGVASGGGLVFFGRPSGLGITRQLVQTDGDGLAEIHGAVIFARGDAQQPVTMAEVFVREADLL